MSSVGVVVRKTQNSGLVVILKATLKTTKRLKICIFFNQTKQRAFFKRASLIFKEIFCDFRNKIFI
nr:MAG TPA: hypothetical protein [Caudoviricetes sp.]